MHVSFPAIRVESSPLPALWAREKIELLQSKDYLGAQTGNPSEEIKQQIIGLALDYRLMSQYTSFVAVEQRVVNVGGKQRTVDVPVEMPDGVSYRGIFGEVDGRLDQQEEVVAEAPAQRLNGDAYQRPQLAIAPLEMPSSIPPALIESAPVANARGGAFPSASESLPPSGGRAAAQPRRQSLTRQKQLPSLANRQAAIMPGAPPSAAPMQPRTGQVRRNPFSEVAELRGAPQAGQSALPRRQAKSRVAEPTRKLAASLRSLLPGSGERAHAPEVEVRDGRTEVQIWLDQLPVDGLKKLKELGFELAAELKPGKLLLGTLPVEKLRALAALDWVQRVEPPNYR